MCNPISFKCSGWLPVVVCMLSLLPQNSFSWGFHAHRIINRMAVYELPPPLFALYRRHIEFFTEESTKPDKRRNAVKNKAPRHFIDLEDYGPHSLATLPHSWKKMTDSLPEDTLFHRGIVPWQIEIMCYRLTKAFEDKDWNLAMQLSTDLGHYIADANVPLHTTSNYDGQKTNQKGLHALWESRLPELFSTQYDFMVGPAKYEKNINDRAFQAVANANLALDSVLKMEADITRKMGEEAKYSFEDRNGQSQRVYSKAFCEAYHKALSGQVERRMQASIQMVADLLYTCWMNAGQPDPTPMLGLGPDPTPEKPQMPSTKPLPDKWIRPDEY